MKSNMLEEIAIYAVINRSSSSDSSILADEVGQECSDEIMNFSYNELFPERILHNSNEKISCMESLSPTFIPRTLKMKLNFDMPENISNIDENNEEVYFNNGEIDKGNCNFDVDISREILPTSEQSELLKSNQEKRSKIDMRQPMPFFINNKLRLCKFDNRIDHFYCPDIKSPLKIIIPNCDDNKTYNPFEIKVSMNESSINNDNLSSTNISLNLPWWKVALVKCYGFSNWLTNIIFELIKTNFQRFCRLFVPMTPESGTTKCTEASNDNLTQITSIIHAENKKIMLAFTEKFNHMTLELNKVHQLSENTLSVLESELDILKNNTNKLVDSNDILTRDLTVFSKKLDDTIKIYSAIPSRIGGSVLTSQVPPPPPPSPPPPPPPPPPPTSHSLSMTPKSQNRNRFSRTPTRKCSTPLVEGRPLITVEDLLKVTLKKAPQTNKVNNPKSNEQIPRGPVVSLDMLRSVKLKSTRRSRNNADTKNVRSPHRAFKGRGTQSFSLSPIMAGAVSPLSRILKQVDNRRRSNKTLMSPTHSDNDLTKDNPKQFDVTQPSNSSHTILV